MLESGPSFVVAIVMCVVFGALKVWFWHCGDAGRGFLLPLCVVAVSVCHQPVSSCLL